MKDQLPVDGSGKLSEFAWPGGYPIFYLTDADAVLCARCANRERDNVAAADIHWEGEPLTCEECNARIESAYGPIDGDAIGEGEVTR